MPSNRFSEEDIFSVDTSNIALLPDQKEKFLRSDRHSQIQQELNARILSLEGKMCNRYTSRLVFYSEGLQQGFCKRQGPVF